MERSEARILFLAGGWVGKGLGQGGRQAWAMEVQPAGKG